MIQFNSFSELIFRFQPIQEKKPKRERIVLERVHTEMIKKGETQLFEGIEVEKEVDQETEKESESKRKRKKMRSG
jgi:hypothetical protein